MLNNSNDASNACGEYGQFGLTTTPGRFKEQNSKFDRYLLPRTYIKHLITIEDFARIVE